MTKLEPQQNFLFHTPQAENCPLFTFWLYFIQPWRGCSICRFIQWDPCQTLSILFCASYPFGQFIQNYKRHGNNEVNSLLLFFFFTEIILLVLHLVWMTFSLNQNDLWQRRIRHLPLTFLKMSLIPLNSALAPALRLLSLCCLLRCSLFRYSTCHPITPTQINPETTFRNTFSCYLFHASATIYGLCLFGWKCVYLCMLFYANVCVCGVYIWNYLQIWNVSQPLNKPRTSHLQSS